MFRSTHTLIIALAFATVVQPAVAKSPQETAVHVRVYYGDLNLQNEVGAQTLLRRITQAARKACGKESYYTSVNAAWSRVNACRANATRNAVMTVNQPLLTAAYAGTHPTAVASVVSR